MDLPRNTRLRKISVTRIVKLKLLTIKSSLLVEDWTRETAEIEPVVEVNDHEFCLLKLKSIERVSAVLHLQKNLLVSRFLCIFGKRGFSSL